MNPIDNLKHKVKCPNCFNKFEIPDDFTHLFCPFCRLQLEVIETDNTKV